ncbi:MAG: DUF2071 domain-containing protein [Labilithrix sp.]|nr:DUF2071 domain-containing protein [Labilithrix sp.]MCW5810997.1 DUF2071 domain-containing protein [Labilithrix sp.]
MGAGVAAAERDLEHVLILAVLVHALVVPWEAWEIAAGMDAVVAIAMMRVAWISRFASAAALVCAGVALAAERRGLPFFLLPAFAWTFAFVRAGVWSRPLSLASAVVAIAFAFPRTRLAAGGALAAWIGLLTEAVLLRARPFEAYGRLARWRHPRWWARPLDVLANSRFFGAVLEPLPEVTMRSDIRDVVYVNYLVAAETAAALVPPGLELQRVGPNGKYALFTFLTYRHGNFGFAFLGPLRRLLPSPVQTNWRIHVFDPNTGHRGIYFLTNAITASLPALAARLTTEGMPMHVLKEGSVTRDADGTLTVHLDPGAGSAPDADLVLRPTAEPPALTGAWAECWTDYRDFLAYCVPQDRAMSSQPLRGRVSRQEIDLGIPLDACAPLEGEVVSRAARVLAVEGEPLCFHVPAVTFTFSIEAHDGQNQ